MNQPITKELIEKAVPANLKNSITQSLVDKLNAITTDPIVAEEVRNNFISYTQVLREGKYKIDDYLNAVSFVSFRLMGCTNQEAYFKTFPDRYQNLLALGKSSKDIANYVSAYTRNQLVNKILEQSIVPPWVLNQHMHQDALNVQYSIMQDEEVSPKVRVEAANSLLTHLAKPKEVGPLLNFDMRESSGMNELKEALTKMAQQQISLIEHGVSTKDIAAANIIDVKAQDAEPSV